jgi:hypothetical protein
MALSKREQHLLATVYVAFTAFTAGDVKTIQDLDGTADISHLSEEELALGERLLEKATKADLEEALATIEADIASVSRPS